MSNLMPAARLPHSVPVFLRKLLSWHPVPSTRHGHQSQRQRRAPPTRSRDTVPFVGRSPTNAPFHAEHDPAIRVLHVPALSALPSV